LWKCALFLISLAGRVVTADSIDQTGQGRDGNQRNKGMHAWESFSGKTSIIKIIIFFLLYVILVNLICMNGTLLDFFISLYIYIYIYICVCVCMYEKVE